MIPIHQRPTTKDGIQRALFWTIFPVIVVFSYYKLAQILLG